ncbi:unnamed protein product, partial [Mesorhabditis belari]|uniref:Kinesin-like protein unc-104 n=1 Tax=Mesorhabditis belari TaxID=2138241 RepID=A0AAF3FT39_9BILA
MSAENEMEKVKVAVRVRPFNKREIDLKTKNVVAMCKDQVNLEHPTDDKQPKNFAFDHAFYSTEYDHPDYASQEEVFECVGRGVLENAFQGYNACIFAYGQTGSGKSYSMMGTADQPGIIPRLCDAVFARIEQTSNDTLNYKVEVSYMEIYNEKVRDLLDPKSAKKGHLKVREHKILGPMVDGLSVLAVSSYEQIASLIEEGNKSRTVAATNMNAESSRSHAVFNIRLTQVLIDAENGFSGEKVAKISLVDLAGSERAGKTGAVGKRLEEGGNINKSLTTLGMVISSLADRSSKDKKDKFIPYRDSVLTWLLKDNLGGNSRTVMIATISPAADNYEETLSTLRYADRAKKIVNHAVINEDPNAKIIRELREEVEQLRLQISQTKKEHSETQELRDRLTESERIVEQMNKSWEDRLKETDSVYKERQRDLANIGISVESSGIKVMKDKFYLVNLNADPSLNELLVYYLNMVAIIGSSEVESESDRPDIVLQGLGIQPHHALLEIVEEFGRHRLYITPLSKEARICVNGKEIEDKTLLRHGFRLLIGINHYFKVNCPREGDMAQSIMDESAVFDYDDAWHEANSGSSANVDQYVEQLARKHEEEKQAALEQQYEAFERYIQNLTAGGMTPCTPMTPGFGLMTPLGTPGSALPPFGFPTNPRQSVRNKFFYWAQKREEMFAEALTKLKKEIVRANALVREANMISRELANSRRQTTYDVTLQIPASNLRPSKIKDGGFVCEPVVVVRRVGMAGCQLWSLTQLENKLVDMRDLYNDKLNGIERYSPQVSPECSPIRVLPNGFEERPDGSVTFDPFFDSQQNHSLVGVANVFLEVLFHELKLDYQVPIISQQGEVAGRLHVEVYRLPSNTSNDSLNESTDSGIEPGRPESMLGKTITCRFRIKRAINLPANLSHFVFCQYSFFNLSEMLVVAPTFDPSIEGEGLVHQNNFVFDHQKDFDVVVTEEFLEYCQEDALSIEVWGHRSCGFDSSEMRMELELKNKTLQDRWREVSRRLELSIQIMEINDSGNYAPVEVLEKPDVPTGGVYQLKQGQQRRIIAGLSLPQNGGGLPLSIEAITSVSIGCVCTRVAGAHSALDSYQEEDLERLRRQWSQALKNRQKYLEEQLSKVSTTNGRRSEKESEREHSLMSQWVSLAEERSALSIPAPNTDIPGAPSDWIPPLGVEQHVPVLFLDLNADDMTGEIQDEEFSPQLPGANCILPKENKGGPLLLLPILERTDTTATCSWDSSIHDEPCLNVATDGSQRIYAIVKVLIRLSHPKPMDIVLRKRICLSVYKKPSITERILKRIVGTESTDMTSVWYDIVAHVPKTSHDMEDRSTLAMMAARAGSEDDSLTDQEKETRQLSYIEAYTKSIQTVESMLKLDRLRQEVAITNMLTKKERQARMQHLGLNSGQFRMKRAVSLPNTIANAVNQQLSVSSHPTTNGQSNDDSRRSLESSMSSSVMTSSLVNSLVSPLSERLSGIDEECLREPVRSSTVPETMQTTLTNACSKNISDTNGNSSLFASVSSTSSGVSSGVDDCRTTVNLSQNNNLLSTKQEC